MWGGGGKYSSSSKIVKSTNGEEARGHIKYSSVAYIIPSHLAFRESPKLLPL